MVNRQLNWIAGFIWGIADDVLRDVYVLEALQAEAEGLLDEIIAPARGRRK